MLILSGEKKHIVWAIRESGSVSGGKYGLALTGSAHVQETFSNNVSLWRRPSGGVLGETGHFMYTDCIYSVYCKCWDVNSTTKHHDPVIKPCRFSFRLAVYIPPSLCSSGTLGFYRGIPGSSKIHTIHNLVFMQKMANLERQFLHWKLNRVMKTLCHETSHSKYF